MMMLLMVLMMLVMMAIIDVDGDVDLTKSDGVLSFFLG